MAVDFNHLVDDDGTGTTGTKIDVAQQQSLLMGTMLNRADTGTINNWAPGIAGHTYVEWTGASDLSVTGLALPSGFTPLAGQDFVFRNLGTAGASFIGGSAASAAGNRLFNATNAAPTPVAGGGSLRYRYSASGYWA